MSDLISRQAAIDAIHNYFGKRLETLPTRMTEDGEVYADIKEIDKILEHNKVLCGMIKHLPSAQSELVRCKDCKWRDKPGCALRIVDDSDKPKDYDFCSYGERKEDNER